MCFPTVCTLLPNLREWAFNKERKWDDDTKAVWFGEGTRVQVSFAPLPCAPHAHRRVCVDVRV